jgi:DNA-binding NarL/FixJ family response regulator
MKSPHKTLLIDDHQLFNDGLNLILTNSPDFRVAGQIFDPQLAREACAQYHPDLVLVDFNMPNLDGLAVVEQLRQLPFRGRIVVVSMYAEQPEIARFKTLNVDGYMAKTIPSEQLLESLRRVMQGERVFVTDKASTSSRTTPDYFWLNYQLTRREMDILQRIKVGMSSEQIATEFELSYHTVQAHRRNINRKLPFKTEKQFYDFLNLLGE